MKITLTILYFIPFLSFSQDLIEVQISYRPEITGYELQFSKDKIDWVTSEPISLPKADGIYSVPVNITSGFWRIHVLGIDQFSDVKQVFIALPVEVTNTSVKNGVITWESHNEDLKYYSIEQSVDGKNFVETGRVMPKGDGNYQFILK